MVKTLEVQALTRINFDAYGQIIDHTALEARMIEKEFTFWNNLAQVSPNGLVDFGIVKVVEREKHFSKVERHLLTEEAFFALDSDCIMLAGLPTPGEKYASPETVRAFHLPKGKGVIFHKGTWHWLPYPLAKQALLMVICRKDTVDDDLEIVDMQDVGVSFEIDLL